MVSVPCDILTRNPLVPEMSGRNVLTSADVDDAGESDGFVLGSLLICAFASSSTAFSAAILFAFLTAPSSNGSISRDFASYRAAAWFSCSDSSIFMASSPDTCTEYVGFRESPDSSGLLRGILRIAATRAHMNRLLRAALS